MVDCHRPCGWAEARAAGGCRNNLFGRPKHPGAAHDGALGRIRAAPSFVRTGCPGRRQAAAGVPGPARRAPAGGRPRVSVTRRALRRGRAPAAGRRTGASVYRPTPGPQRTRRRTCRPHPRRTAPGPGRRGALGEFSSRAAAYPPAGDVAGEGVFDRRPRGPGARHPGCRSTSGMTPDGAPRRRSR
jgi:hypothetical protein